jgi:hypothetical protein
MLSCDHIASCGVVAVMGHSDVLTSRINVHGSFPARECSIIQDRNNTEGI